MIVYDCFVAVFMCIFIKSKRMKQIFAICLMLLSFQALAQKINSSEVPEIARTSFNKNFPKAVNVKWEKEDGNYEASFVSEGRKMAAAFNGKGDWLETEFKIEISELPKTITDYLEKNYPDAQIRSAEKINMTNDRTWYEVVINDHELILDANGKLIKTRKE